MSEVTWKQVNVEGWQIAQFLTQHNFQPGKFLIIPCVDGSPNWVTVIAVDKETA